MPFNSLSTSWNCTNENSYKNPDSENIKLEAIPKWTARAFEDSDKKKELSGRSRKLYTK